MKALEKLFGRTSAEIAADLLRNDEEAAALNDEIAAHAARQDEAAAESDKAAAEWVAQAAILRNKLQAKSMRRETLAKALATAGARETVQQNQARRAALEKETTTLIAQAPALEKAMSDLMIHLAKWARNHDECLAFNTAKLDGVDLIKCAAERISEGPEGGWALFWRKTELPSIRHPQKFMWSGRDGVTPGYGQAPE